MIITTIRRRAFVPLSRAALAVAVCTPLADAQTLSERLDRLVALVEHAQHDARVPGMALGVVVGGEVVLARGFGRADVDSGAEVTPDTVFGIGSSTKSFTAVLVGMLVDEGLLDLDDSVATHVPGVVLRGTIEPTLQDCLSHATGLARMELISGNPEVTFDELLEHVRRAELLVPYRTAFNYSNINFALVGEALARTAHVPWDALIAERIFAPLGMSRSNTNLAQRATLDDVAVGYESLDEGDDASAGFERSMVWDLRSIAAAGAINSSVTDMLAWVSCLLSGGERDGVRLVEQETLERLWTPQVPLGPSTSYASGFFVEQRAGHRLVYHGGNVPGFAAQVVLFPDDHVGVVLMTNVMVSPLQDAILGMSLDCLLGDTLPAAPGEGDVPAYPDDLERFSGSYWFEQGDMAMTAQIADGKLALDVPGQRVYELLPPGDDGKWVFALTDTIAVSFEQQGDEPAASMTMFQAGMEFVMPRWEREIPEGLPTAAELLARLKSGARGDHDDRDASDDHGVSGEESRARALILVGEVRFPHQGAVGDFTLFSDGGRRMLDVSDFGALGEQRTVIDGDRGWSVMPSGWIEPMDADEIDSTLRAVAGVMGGDWSALYTELEVVGREQVDDGEVYLVEGRSADGSNDELEVSEDGRLLSSATHFSLGPLGSMLVHTTFSDWRDLDGVPVAYHAVSDMGQMGRVEYLLGRISHDAEIDESWFASPRESQAESVGR